MKIVSVVTICLVASLSSNLAQAQKKNPSQTKKPSIESVNIAPFVFDQSLWETSISDFQSDPSNKKYKFRWQSEMKKGLRSEGVGLKLLGMNTGEVIIISNKGKEMRGVSISFFNKGDNGSISANALRQLTTQLKEKISGKLSVKPSTQKTSGTVELNKNIWKVDGTSYSLEQSISGKGTAEFLRLRVMSSKTASRGESTANRSSLRANVVRDKESGDFFIDNIPMVDQGKKGYCACASAARIYQYYGRTTDQHEIAQLAGSSARGGTSIAAMVGSLKKVTGSLNSRVNILYEYPKGISESEYSKKLVNGFREMMRDVNSYQQLAKKNGKKGVIVNGRTNYPRVSSKEYISFDSFVSQCDPETYREIMMEKNSFSRFESKIREYVDQGIPIGWCLNLGLFPEPGLPQARGGHMRLIIGYNREKKEVIYTDSWGKGHAKKSMDLGKAFCMTNALLVLPPTK